MDDFHSEQITLVGTLGYSKRMPSWTHMERHHTGYEFRYKNQPVGAVELFQRGVATGRVWIKDDLPSELKFIIAAVSQSLLVQKEVFPNLFLK